MSKRRNEVRFCWATIIDLEECCLSNCRSQLDEYGLCPNEVDHIEEKEI